MRIRSADIGYRYVKTIEIDGEPDIYESVYADIIGVTHPTINAKSCLIEYISANNEANQKYVGKRWVIGSSAKDMRQYKTTLTSDKADLALKLGLACFKQKFKAQGETSIKIDRLLTSLPDPDRNADVVIKALQGKHTFKRNGVLIHLEIKEVQVFLEGLGTYWFAKQEGLVPDGAVGVMDLGGKTCNLVLFNEEGEFIPDSHASFSTGGTYGLASAIASDRRLTTAIKDAAKIDILMDAIAQQTFRYGQKEISFKEYFDDYKMQWFGGILGELETRWQNDSHRIVRVLITGGSAELVANIIEGEEYFKVVPDSQFANVRGLLLMPEAGSPLTLVA
jgi:hypothetical protein